MNILMITQMYPQPDDLGENKVTRTVEYFAKEWIAEGHKVIVIHCSSKFPMLLYMIPKKIKDLVAFKTSTIIPTFNSRKRLARETLGIKVFRIPMFKMLPGNNYSKRKIKSASKEISDILEKETFTPDIVMGHFANPSLELVKLISSRYNSKSSIVFHNEVNEKSVKKYRIKENIAGVNAIGARSIVEAVSIQKLLKLKEVPFVCFSGVPNDAVKKASLRCNKHDFSNGIKHIYVGSLISRKHLDKAIDAFLKVGSQKDTFKIIGGGPEEERLKGIVLRAKANNITFMGRMPREEVLDQMRQSQVFTLISDNETFGMVYIEAMLQGCLVIASKGGGFDGIIQDGINGFICNAGDSEMLSNIYEKINNMTIDERNKIGQAAIDTAIHFSERDVADRYLNEVLKRNER